MKKSIICAALCSLILASCSMEEESYTQIAKDDYMNDASEAQTVLLGLYDDLTSDYIYGFQLSMFFALPTDLAKVEGSSLANFRNVPCNSYTSSDSYVQNTWAALYSAVYDCNDFMETLSTRMSDYDDEDKELATVYMAEARAIRALLYFELVRWFGNIPLMETTAQSNQLPSTFVQADPVEVYEFIEEDLQYAISVLPYSCDDEIRSDNSFRISKGGALGLLAKVYATWAGYPVQDESKWQLAAETAKTLVDSGKHSLIDDYEQLWFNSANSLWDESESLIEISFYSPTSTSMNGRVGKWIGVYIADGASDSGRSSAYYRALPSFASTWKDYELDQRWSITYADYYYSVADGKRQTMTYTSNGSTVYGTLEMAVQKDTSAYRKVFNNSLYPGKWDMNYYVESANVISNANFSNVNWYVLRYADVLLLYAEALNEWKGGPTSEAYEAVNMVRRRGFGTDVTDSEYGADLTEGMDYEEFQQAIRDERAYELAFEGHRRQDLVRWGIYYDSIIQAYLDLQEWEETAASYYLAAEYTIEGKNELLPIPLRDIDLTNFTQNPGWE